MRMKKDNKVLIKAEQKYIRMTPRKLRLVTDAIKKLTPQQAIENLPFLRKRASGPILKTLKQAVANAQNNLKIPVDDLKFAKIEILEGPTYKRWRAVSRGRAHSIFKRTSHIRIILWAKEIEDKDKAGFKEKGKKKDKDSKAKKTAESKKSKQQEKKGKK
jgi:large subunit ribosomal protein L22